MDLPIPDGTTFHKLRNAFEEDLYLWDDSLNLLPKPELTASSWIFQSSTRLHICVPKIIYAITSDESTITSLALFDLHYAFWEVNVAQNANRSSDHQNLIAYHRALRSKILDAILHPQTPRQELDIVLQAWLMRTLCLYSHDLESRQQFQTLIRPSYLTKDVVLQIINSATFKHYLRQLVGPVVGGQEFQCANGQRSWEMLGLGNKMDSRVQKGADKDAKGIFLFPHEKFNNIWNLIRNNPDFLRQNVIDSKSIAKLKPRQWLNDEIINGYINLLDRRTNHGVLVCNTFFYAKLASKSTITSRELLGYLRHKNASLTIQEALHSYRQIIIPINWMNTHWLAVVLDVTTCQIIFMDSLPDKLDIPNPLPKHQDSRRVGKIMRVIKSRLSLGSKWTSVEASVPVQSNTYDCGVFCAQFIKFVYLEMPVPDFVGQDLVDIRNMMTLELYEQKLRWFTSIGVHKGKERAV